MHFNAHDDRAERTLARADIAKAHERLGHANVSTTRLHHWRKSKPEHKSDISHEVLRHRSDIIIHRLSG
jgi:hypothetical protein